MKNLCLIFLVGLVGCAGATYSEYSGFGRVGYKSEKISENVYSVSFFGNGWDTKKIVYDFFIKKCSDIAKENSKKGFCIQKIFAGDILNGPSNWPYQEGTIEIVTDAKFDNEKCFKVE